MRNELQGYARGGSPCGETEGRFLELRALWREGTEEFAKLSEFLGCVAKRETDYPPYRNSQSKGSAPPRFGTIIPPAWKDSPPMQVLLKTSVLIPTGRQYQVLQHRISSQLPIQRRGG